MKHLFFLLPSVLVAALLLGMLFLRRSYAVVDPVVPKRDYRVRVVEAVLLAEARGEGPGGIERVAEVIRNRMIEKGRTAVQIVGAPYQFSCLSGITTDILLEKREGWYVPSDTFNTAQRCAYALVFDSSHGRAFKETRRNLTRGATHYHAAGPQPKWAVGRKPVHTYKNHIFYKL